MRLFGKNTASFVVDPVCGMRIEPPKAAGTETHDSRAFYFCSRTCRAAFRNDPHRYAHG